MKILARVMGPKAKLLVIFAAGIPLAALTDSTIMLTASANPAVWGQSLTFGATVSAGATGTVTLHYDSASGTQLSSPVALNRGQAQLPVLLTRAGTYSVVAVYSGDSGFAASTSDPLNLQVNPATPSLMITQPAANASFVVGGAPVTLQANIGIQPPAQGSLSGPLYLLDNEAILTSVPLYGGPSTVSVVISSLSAGPHLLSIQTSAIYDSAGNLAIASATTPGVPVTVIYHWPTYVNLKSDPIMANWQQSVTLTAELIPGPPAVPQVATGNVSFFDSLNFPNGTSVAMSGYVASLTISNLRVGTHVITASYLGDANFAASGASNPVSITVNPLNTITTLASPTGNQRLTAGQTLTLSAQVDAPAAGVTASGSVQFLDSGAPVGSATLSAGVASLDMANLAPGPHSFSARFIPAPDAQGDIDFAGSISTPVVLNAINLSSLPQVISGANWDFTLNAVNLGTTPAQAHFQFFDNNGNPLALPMTLAHTAGAVISPAFDQSLASNAQVVLQSSGVAATSPLIGWGQITGTGGAAGFGIFNNRTYGWSAVVPLETRNESSYILAFDNTSSLATGLAIANIAGQTAAIPVIIRDDSGVQIGTASLNLAAQGHASFVLDQQYPVTAGKRGTVEFDRPLGGQISVMGLRGNGPALTTLPVLANVGTNGGAFAHCTYNGGFTSTFYLVNTGQASAPFVLSFFDESGNALTAPITLPQTMESLATSQLTRTLAAGAMLVVSIDSDNSLPAVVGSVELTTSGNIGGYEIFRWTTFGQEASVPLETRPANDYVLVFDNTNDLTTGVAIANMANWPEDIAVILRDENGTQLQTGSIHLAAQGHTSFTLSTAFPSATNVRGMIDFVAPLFGKISVTGLRAKADGTLTTIPTLTR